MPTSLIPLKDLQLFFSKDEFRKAQIACEKAIEVEPTNRFYYWYLGLSLLLQGNEHEAQTTWFFALSNTLEEEIETITFELIYILDEEAGVRQEQGNHQDAWLIRNYIRELDPTGTNNLLLLIQVSLKSENFIVDYLYEWDVINLVESEINIHSSILRTTIGCLLDENFLEESIFNLIEKSLQHFKDDPKEFISLLIGQCSRIGYGERKLQIAAKLLELGLRIAPHNLEILKYLSVFHQNLGDYEKGIQKAQQGYDLADNLVDKIAASHALLRGLMGTGGQWNKVDKLFSKHLDLLDKFIQEQPTNMSRAHTNWMFNAAFFQPYLRDNLSMNRKIQNEVAKICQLNSQEQSKELVAQFRVHPSRPESMNLSRPLKVGYISACLKKHSVGWLARWLYKYHNREEFDIYSYFVNYQFNGFDALQNWYEKQSTKTRKLDADGASIAKSIYDDDLDLLIDLDSLTMDTTCHVMSLKPSPVQATWLGWDASGIPAIDYFIVDPYVLPEGAETDYSEKLYRLPKTYISVEGFELGVPSLNREDLGISGDAVVFFSGQRGHKRHPKMVRLQMQIIHNVPNSYFLIKSPALDTSQKNLFRSIAEKEGVSCERLKFLPGTPTEAMHRANLSIADVVLDTYPYNGATTTLEALWVGLPLVTRVGDHFSSRNSYTMLMNAGVEEGIAWTDNEYIEWGVRLGKNATLRQQVAWKLLQSRRSAPLWQAKQFTRDMEHAYKQMCMK